MVKKGSLAQKIHWLSQTLILSGILNVIFLGIFFYFLVRENPFPLAYDYPLTAPKMEEVSLPEDIIRAFAPLTSHQLRAHLREDKVIQHGYRSRDFALALLAYRDHIDIRRALGKKNLTERKWKVGTKHEIILYPDLEEEDFKKIDAFLEIEEWPQTSFGLYCLLKKQGLSAEPSLLKAFCNTHEFLALETLFGRTGLPIKKGTLLALACEAQWKDLSGHLQTQKEGCDFSQTRRQEFLLHALDSRSKTAAYLLLITDFDFATKQLDNPHTCLVLDLITQKTKEAALFAKEMALSPRSDAVRQKAVARLHSFGIECSVAKSRSEPTVDKPLAAKPGPRPSVGELRPKFREKPPASPPPGIHVIQPGESLWLIAKKYKVTIEDIMAINQLSSPTIRPGKTLKIPRH